MHKIAVLFFAQPFLVGVTMNLSKAISEADAVAHALSRMVVTDPALVERAIKARELLLAAAPANMQYHVAEQIHMLLTRIGAV